MSPEQKEKVEDVAGSHQLAVVATSNGLGNPEAALVGFAYLPETSEVIFGTFQTFRKYHNIKNNNRVAMVIGWDEAKTIQYEGCAFELSGQEREKMEECYLKKFPNAKKYLHSPEERFFKIVPEWMRYRDLSKRPEEVFEIKF